MKRRKGYVVRIDVGKKGMNGENVLSICRKTSRKVRLSVLEAREAKDGYVML